MEIAEILTDEQFLPAAQTLVENAQKQIYISTFKAELTTKPRGRRLVKFFDTVIEKSRLGLDVRLLINKRENYGHIPITNLYAVKELRRNKVQVRHLQNNRLCHAKIIIVDNTEAILGSHNLSIKSCHNNFEVSLLTHIWRVVERLHGVYIHAWERAKEG